MSSEQPPKDHFGSIPIANEDDKGQETDIPLISDDGELNHPQESSPQSFIEPVSQDKTQSHRRAYWIILGLASLLTVYILSGFFLAPYLMRTIIPEWAAKKNERPIAVGSASFNPLTLTATLYNGIIGPKKDELGDNADPILSFGLLKINFSFFSFLSGDLVAQELHCNDLFLHLVRRQDSTLNIANLMQSSQKDKKETAPSFMPISSSFSLRNITVENSEILYQDKKNNSTHRVEELQMALPYLSNQRKQQGLYRNFLTRLNQGVAGKDELIRPQFSAKINGSPMILSGETEITDEAVEATLNIQLKSLDLADLWSSLPQSNHAVLSKGSADLDLNLVFTTSHDSSPELLVTGDATLLDLWFQDRQGKEIARIPRVHLSGEGSPLKRVFHFSNCLLEEPNLHLEKISGGNWPLTQFFNKKNVAGEKEAKSFLWSVDQLKISNGVAGIIDKTLQGGFSMSLTDVQGTLSSIGNNSIETGTFAITARLGENGGLSFQGNLDQDTKETAGTLVLKNINLAQFSPYLTSASSIHIKSGQLNSFESSFQWLPYEKNRNPFILSKANILVSDLSLFNNDQNIFNSKELSLTKGEVDFAKRFLDLGYLSTHLAELTMSWDSNDKLSWISKADNKESSWQVYIQDLEADKSQFRVVHEGLEAPFSYPFKNITLKAHNLSGKGKTDNVNITANLPNKGTVSLSGSFSIHPFSGSLATKIDSLSLPDLQPLLSSWLVPEISSGTLTANGGFSLPEWSFNGAVTLDNFLAQDEKGKILACQKASTEDLHLGFSPFFFHATNIPIEKPFFALAIKANEPLNKQFIKSKDGGHDSINGNPIFRIDHLGLTNGTLKYRDETTTPQFSLIADNIQGSATGLIKKPDSRAHFSLNGTITRASGFGIESTTSSEMTAPISMSGSAGLFDSDVFFDLKTHFKDLSLVPLSPYLEPHLGYLIRRGNLEATISYFLEKRTVKAENNLLVHRFKLGEPIADVTNLPLTLAILTDQKGVISLDIPVKGDKNDTSFSVRGALLKSIRNLFIRTMTSPFILLSSIFPDQPAPDTIHFAFGNSKLTDEAKSQLSNFAQVLHKRPWLQISLKGFADSKGDIDALLALQNTEKLRRQLERERKLAEQIPSTYGKEEIIPLRDVSPKRGNDIEVEEIGTPEIGEKTLHRLARKRCKSVQRFLTDSGVAPERIIETTQTSLVKEDNLGRSGNRVQFSLESLMP